jgi:hypothetical protein
MEILPLVATFSIENNRLKGALVKELNDLGKYVGT